jgi:hypothetical protein
MRNIRETYDWEGRVSNSKYQYFCYHIDAGMPCKMCRSFIKNVRYVHVSEIHRRLSKKLSLPALLRVSMASQRGVEIIDATVPSGQEWNCYVCGKWHPADTDDDRRNHGFFEVFDNNEGTALVVALICETCRNAMKL